jgi:16S rRNA (guanine966-N2)-methyltransferase
MDVLRPPKAVQAANLIFLDPPYRKGLVEKAVVALMEASWIAKNALLICETAKDETLDMPKDCKEILVRTYGDTTIRFFTVDI